MKLKSVYKVAETVLTTGRPCYYVECPKCHQDEGLEDLGKVSLCQILGDKFRCLHCGNTFIFTAADGIKDRYIEVKP